MLREGILTSEPVNSLSSQSEVFYRRLISVVDDYGRYYAKPTLLRAKCYPLQLEKINETDIAKFLAEVCNTKPPLVVVYAVGAKRYLQLLNFRQKVRAKKSLFPEPPTECMACAMQMWGECDASAHLGVGVDVVVDVVEGDRGGRQASSTSPCPHQEIIALYAKHLPTGRQVRPPWNGTRAHALSARWKELPERQRIEWWDQFFAHCARSPFLTGRIQPRQGRKAFEVSLDWIVTASNFQKIVEGAYDD